MLEGDCGACQFVKELKSLHFGYHEKKIEPEEACSELSLLGRKDHQQGLIKLLLMRIEVRQEDRRFGLIFRYEEDAE